MGSARYGDILHIYSQMYWMVLQLNSHLIPLSADVLEESAPGVYSVLEEKQHVATRRPTRMCTDH